MEELGGGAGLVVQVPGEQQVVTAEGEVHLEVRCKHTLRTSTHPSLMEQAHRVDRVVRHLEPIPNIGGKADLREEDGLRI